MKEVEVPVEILDFIESRCYPYERFKDETDTRSHLIFNVEGLEKFKLFTVGAKRLQAPA